MPLPMQKLVLGLRERYCKPINIKKNSTEMTILHISDTHNLHHKITSPLISKADILIHSGDITNNGTEQEVLDFLNIHTLHQTILGFIVSPQPCLRPQHKEPNTQLL